MHKFGRYLLTHNVRAYLITLLCMLLPWPVSALAVVIIALVTLQKGVHEGLIALSWAVLPAAIATWKWPAIAVTYDIGFVVCVLAWFLASLLRRQLQWAYLLEYASALGMLLVVGFYLLPQATFTYLMTGLEQFIIFHLSQAMQNNLEMIQDAVHKIIPFLLGGLYAALALFAIIYLMLARLWQLKLRDDRVKYVEFYSIRVGRIMSLLVVCLVVATIIWHFNWLIALSTIIILPFIFSGFSLLIFLNAISNHDQKYLRVVLVVVAVLALLFLARYVFILLVCIGFIDSWVNFRKLRFFRIKRINS